MATYYVTPSGNDANAGTSEGTAFASPGKAAATAGVDDTIYIKDGTYTLTSAVENADGGPPNFPARSLVQGYQVTPDDLGARPVISAGAITPVSGNLITLGVSGFNNVTTRIRSIEADANNQGVIGINVSGNYNMTAIGCLARNATIGFLGSGGKNRAIGCTAINNSSHGFSGVASTYCLSRDNGGDGFFRCGGLFANVAIGNTGYGFELGTGSNNPMLAHCIAMNNGLSGFRHKYDILMIVNCIALGSGHYGFSTDNSNGNPSLTACASYNNTSGRRNGGGAMDLQPITLTADPFVDSTNDVFSLNTDPGGGELLKNVGLDFTAGFGARFDVSVVSDDAGGGIGKKFSLAPMGVM